MQIEEIDVLEAIKQGQKLPFVYAKNLSDMYFGKNPYNFNLDENLEARFFDKTQEIRIFDGKAVKITAKNNENTINKTYKIQNAIYGTEFDVCIHLDFDEDGQAFVKTKRMTEWRGN